MRTFTPLSIAAGLAVASGCSPVSVNAHVTPGTNLEQFHTFGFVTPTSAQAAPKSIADQSVESAIKQNLSLKGITPAAPDTQPDFLVGYHIKKQEAFNTEDWGYFAGPEVYTYVQGTVIIDFIDPKTNKVFWRGTASAALEHPESPDPQKIAEATGKVIKKYPYSYGVAGSPPPAM
jgi:hypothetical protein